MAAQIESNYIVPGRAESYWIATTPESNYPALPSDIRVDVAILGGGISWDHFSPSLEASWSIRCSS